MSGLVQVMSLYPSGVKENPSTSIFPLLSMKNDRISFIAHFSLEVDVNKITSYKKLTLYPMYLRNTYSFNKFNDLYAKKCFVFLTVSTDFSNVLVYVPNLAKQVDYDGDLEVIIRNDVIGDDRGESKLTFPGKKGFQFRVFDDKFQQAFDVIAKDYIEFVHAVGENRDEKNIRALKQKVKVDSLPAHLVRIEAIARPAVTTNAVASLPPVSRAAAPKDKNLISRLFS